MLPVIPDAIPAELRQLPAWVCWCQELRNGRWTKVPLNPITGVKAKTDDSSTWGNFDEAISAYQGNGYDGIGLCRTADLVLVDLDGCRNLETGALGSEPWVFEILAVLEGQAYLEISASGSGVHAVCRGRLPKGRRQWDDPERDHFGFAFYDRNRYFTFTGRVLATSGPIIDLTRNLASLHAKLFPSVKLSPRALNPSDSDLIQRARRAKNGPKFCRLWDGLWKGDYPSRSEADLALCCLLAFWTRKDASRIDRLFRASALMREKWERDEYRSLTVLRAIEMTTDMPSYEDLDGAQLIHVGSTGNATQKTPNDGKERGIDNGEIPSGFTLTDTGLYSSDGKRISPFIKVVGRACTFEETGYGVLLQFEDCRRQKRHLILSRKLLYADGAEALNELIDRGFEPSRDKQAIRSLKEYLCQSSPEIWVRHVPRTGWHAGTFVFPDATIFDAEHEGAERLLFHTEEPVQHKFAISGTLQQWQQHVSRMCRGNSRLIFSVSCAFAASLLHLVRLDNVGFHFKSFSTAGKTTALLLAPYGVVIRKTVSYKHGERQPAGWNFKRRSTMTPCYLLMKSDRFRPGRYPRSSTSWEMAKESNAERRLVAFAL